MSTISLYTFEDASGSEQTFTTFNAAEAKETAERNGWKCYDNEYEYSDRNPAWDFTDSIDFDQWDDSEYDVEGMRTDHRNGNFSEDDADDYRHENIVRASLVNGQFEQAKGQCQHFGMDYEVERNKFQAAGRGKRTPL